MSTVEFRRTTDWPTNEKRTDGGGNYGGGNHDIDGGGLPDRPDNDNRGWGIVIGAGSGALVGAYGSTTFAHTRNINAVNRYIAQHHIVVTPSNRSEVELNAYNQVVDRYMDAGTISGAMLVGLVFGAVLGKKIDKRFKQDD